MLLGYRVICLSALIQVIKPKIHLDEDTVFTKDDLAEK